MCVFRSPKLTPGHVSFCSMSKAVFQTIITHLHPPFLIYRPNINLIKCVMWDLSNDSVCQLLSFINVSLGQTFNCTAWLVPKLKPPICVEWASFLCLYSSFRSGIIEIPSTFQPKLIFGRNTLSKTAVKKWLSRSYTVTCRI